MTQETANGSAADVQAHVRAVTLRSGSSFLWGMRILPKERREAMYAIYAFCREVDDVADEPAPMAEKLAELQAWRREIENLYDGRPTRPTTHALLPHLASLRLPKAEFLEVIDGMEMDARGTMIAPDMQTLRLYCRRVAGAVGLLSVYAFGDDSQAAKELAIAEGEALQFTNILRDVAEDAAEGRLYLPRELLERAGIEITTPQEVLQHPALPQVCYALATTAQERFALARNLLRRCERRRLKPAVIMLEVYERLLNRLERRGWDRLAEPVSVPKLEKIGIALRHAIF